MRIRVAHSAVAIGRQPLTSPPEAISPFRRALRNVGWLLTGKGLGAVLSIVYLALATRSLGVQTFGVFTLILSTAQAVAALVGFQTWQIVVRFGMVHRESGASAALSRLVRFCLALDIGGALVGIGIAGAALWLMQAHFDWSTSLAWQAFAFSVVLLLSVRSTAVGVLRLHDRFAIGAGADAVTPMARFVGALIAVWQDATLTGFLIAWAAAEVLTAVGYWISAARVAPDTLRSWRGTTLAPSENPGIWHFAFVTNLNSTLNAASRQFAVVLVGLLTGAAAAGNYRLAYQLSQSLVRLADMFARGVFPEVTRAHASQRAGELRKLVRQSAKLAMGVGLATCVLVPLLGKPALYLIAGEAYLGAYPVLVLLGLAAGLDIMAVGFEPVLLGTGHAARALRIRMLSAAVLFSFVILLMPSFGIIGAGAASLIASAVALIALMRSAYVLTRA
ncbi:lipopolysaccharide biosynthesis protein [Sphingomonas sp. IC4-52]|uniref:lipopolysaccharide biosynthesis protein n=1 Tax=Sphingomonas sp. IC4-52 TaxID=2887202 RepID=UPI001D10A0C5|nr:oligosaccharide flippase family protein [Sphingomonas sp. IC4-52]MCC2981551.1 oligosaccharide flippase family protein [Sphingomonas sp. IC4-52]